MMDSQILKLGAQKCLQLIRQWQGHFGTVKTNYFFGAGYWKGHLKWIANRMMSGRSKKRVPKQLGQRSATEGAR